MANHSSSDNPGDHIRPLDGLRGLAVLAVVFHHNLPRSLVDPGGAGVSLFFVLSGFLITGILLRARDRALQVRVPSRSVLGAFYARRFLRIFPLYYAAVAVGLFLGLPSLSTDTWWHFAYLSNVLTAKRGEWLPQPAEHFWTLSVEEQYYLIIPALILLARPGQLKWILSGLVILAPLCRMALTTLTGNSVQAVVLLPCCLDTLGAGALLALFRHQVGSARESQLRGAGVVFIIGVALVALDTLLRDRGWAWRIQIGLHGFSYAAIFAGIIWWAALSGGSRAAALLESKPLVYLGTISYGLYVIHEFVPPLLEMMADKMQWDLPEPGYPRVFIVLLISVVLASVSWYFYEKPINNLKCYFPYVAVPKPKVALALEPEKVG